MRATQLRHLINNKKISKGKLGTVQNRKRSNKEFPSNCSNKNSNNNNFSLQNP